MSSEDPYFSCVKYAKSLAEMGLGFISVTKQATHRFPMDHIQRKVFTHRYDSCGLVYEEANKGVHGIMEFVWVDRDRQ